MRSAAFLRLLLACVTLFVSVGLARTQESGGPPVVVTFDEPKVVVSEAAATGPVDPALRIKIQPSSSMAFGINADNIRLTFSSGSIRTTFKIDNQLVVPGGAPSQLVNGKPAKDNRPTFVSAYKHGNLHIAQTVEAIPTRPTKSGAKRHIDAAFVRYVIGNKDTQPHTFGLRVRFDTYCATNDGALFAAPTTMPGKILDGIELKDKTLPPFVQIMQRADLKNPGAVGHFTLKLGRRMIGPDRFVCTYHGAAQNGWEVAVRRAMGDSDCVMYWKDHTIQPGGKLTFAYAYGKGLARDPGSEGRYTVSFGGSFEPGKLFTIAAHVEDPASNQTLALDLPKGMQLVEGKRVQPVPTPGVDSATSMVLWKCRVKKLGKHTIRFRSSSGVTQTRTITVSRAGDD